MSTDRLVSGRTRPWSESHPVLLTCGRHTPADTAADFDQAQGEAEQMAKNSGRNWVVRHHDRQASRLILTATPEDGIVWPRLAPAPVPAAELADRLERERPGRDTPAAAAGLDVSDYTADGELEA